MFGDELQYPGSTSSNPRRPIRYLLYVVSYIIPLLRSGLERYTALPALLVTCLMLFARLGLGDGYGGFAWPSCLRSGPLAGGG